MQNIIKTEKSFLNVYKLDENILMTICVAEIDDKLMVNPPLGRMYGKQCFQNRNVGFFSNDSVGYNYSNQIMYSQSLPDSLVQLLKIMNERFNADFNGILINKYIDGNNYISAHSDNETELDQIGVLAISVGAVRKFRIRNIHTKEIVADVPTQTCHIIHMGGEFQNEFTHEIPVEKKVKDARYSFTFRKHLK